MPTQPSPSETDTTQPASPKAQPKPEPAKRKPGEPLVPRDTHPNPAEQKEPPVEDF